MVFARAGYLVSDHGQAYAIWLMPAEDDAGLFSALIDELARRLGTPAFPPHATLCSGAWRGSLSDLKTKVDGIAHQCVAPRVAAAGLGGDDSRFHFFYLALKRDGLAHITRLAERALPSSHRPNVGPHISLIYCEDIEAVDRQKLMRELTPRLPSLIAFGRLALVLPDGNDWHDIENWRSIHQIPFNG